MKIFVDCHVFDGNLQGTTTYLKGLYTELIKDKSKTFYLASSNPENLKTIFGIHENVIYLSYSNKNKFFRLLFDIPKLIKQNTIDFAHFQYIVPPIKKCKYIVTIHDVLFLDYPEYFPLLYRLKNKFLFKLSAQFSDVVLTVSEYSKAQIQKHFNLDTITVTRNAVDPAFYETYNKEEVKTFVKEKFGIENYFLFVSRWEPRKNHHNLLKAFVENQFYKNHQLVFVGNHALQNQTYVDYFNTLDETIKEKISSLNNIDFFNLVQITRAASISIYPSIAEGFGIPPLEAIASEVPSICSNTSAMSDFDFIDKNLFNPNDVNDIANKITIGLHETNLSQKKQIVLQKYNWESSAKEFNTAIESISSKK